MRLEQSEEQKQIDKKQIESERQKRSNVERLVNDVVDDVSSERRFDAMRKIVESGRQDDAFFLCDQDQLVKNFKYWTEKLKNVTPYFGEICESHFYFLYLYFFVATIILIFGNFSFPYFSLHVTFIFPIVYFKEISPRCSLHHVLSSCNPQFLALAAIDAN